MGAVLVAHDPTLGREVAIKLMLALDPSDDPSLLLRFQREAETAARLAHPGIVAVHEAGVDRTGRPFIVQELIEGESLQARLDRQGPLAPLDAALVVRDLARALAYAHARGVVHRDLKPANVLLTPATSAAPPRVLLTDFGVAKDVLARHDLTRTSELLGTATYMAPEQAGEGARRVDARADLYALGCIMYEMLCGMRPFDAESKVALLGMQVTAPVPPMASKSPDANVPPNVEAIVKQLLAKEATERLGDARELIDAITAVMNQLAAEGRIDAGYAAPPRSAVGTNPGIISGFGPAPDLGPPGKAAPPPGKGGDILGGKAWIIAAGGGLIGLLVLVITIVAVLKRNTTTGESAEAGTTSGSTIGDVLEPSVDRKITEAIAKIDKGDYGSGIEALERLGAEAQGREEVHRALFKAYSQTNQPKEAMREVGLVIKTNPAIDLRSEDGIALRQEIRNTALLEGQPTANKGAVDEAFSLLCGRIGTIGYDDLYDVAYGSSGMNYPAARARAKKEIARGERAKMSPALAVTADLHVADNSCHELKKLLGRAVESGDERTLNVLSSLTEPRRRGHYRKTDLLGCIHEGSLTKAIAELDARLKKK